MAHFSPAAFVCLPIVSGARLRLPFDSSSLHPPLSLWCAVILAPRWINCSLAEPATAPGDGPLFARTHTRTYKSVCAPSRSGVGLSRFIVPGWLRSHYNTQSGVPLMHRTHTQTISISATALSFERSQTLYQTQQYTTYKCHTRLSSLLKLCCWAQPVMSVSNTHLSTSTHPTYCQSSCGGHWKTPAATCRPLWSGPQSLGCSDRPGSPPWRWCSRSDPEDTSSDVHLQ